MFSILLYLHPRKETAYTCFPRVSISFFPLALTIHVAQKDESAFSDKPRSFRSKRASRVAPFPLQSKQGHTVLRRELQCRPIGGPQLFDDSFLGV